MSNEKMKNVCVTGGAGFLASWLVMRLLQRGYTVHVTSRNLAQENVQRLKKLAGTDSQLRLFATDLCDEEAVQQAIQGCYYVIHMATPFPHTLPAQFKDTTEAAMAIVNNIVEACIKSATAKRLIFTGTIVSASPLKDLVTQDSTDVYHDFIDESCWTPIDTDLPLADNYLLEYTRAKTVAEKELLKYNEIGNIEVVSLVPGLTGGDTIHGSTSDSMKMLLSQIKGDEAFYRTLRFIEEVVGKVPVVHVEDVCNAHIYCMENASIRGRVFCVNGYLRTADIADYFVKHCPGIQIPQRMIEDTHRSIRWGSSKLEDVGFKYQYDAHETLEWSIKCAIRLDELTVPDPSIKIWSDGF